MTNTQEQLTISSLLVSCKPQIAAALPKHMTADRMTRIALTEVRKNPKLQECSPVSLLGAVIQTAQLGLEPGIHSYLIPFYNKKAGQYEVQMIPSYRGLIALARRSGEITSFSAHAVHELDFFHYEYGSNQSLKHVPSQEADAGRMIGAYAIVEFKHGAVQFEYMTHAAIEKIRIRAKAGNTGPWVTDYDEMAKKTVSRRLCKYLPLSFELAQAESLEDQSLAGESQDLGFIIDGDYQSEPDPQARTYVTQKEISEKVAQEARGQAK